MTITLHYHPFSSYCQKVLIGLYELDVPFERVVVDLGDATSRAAFYALWPLGKFPVLVDHDANETWPETSIILEWLAERFAPNALLPHEPHARRLVRLRDRFFDLYVNTPMGKIVTDLLRPEGQRDGFGVTEARTILERAYGILESWLAPAGFAVGSAFTMADCAAAPALFYANEVVPFVGRFPRLSSYYDRLSARPSYVRVFAEAAPFLPNFPPRRLR